MGQKIKKPPLRMAQFQARFQKPNFKNSILKTPVDRSRPRLRLWNGLLGGRHAIAPQLGPLATEV
jgi:hypothetical protein